MPALPIDPAYPAPPDPDGGHLPHLKILDGVRATSILLVLAGHMLPLGPQDWGLNAAVARMGMALFFCLSGFLIVSMLWRDPDVPAFLVKRLLRIVPALFVYLTVLLVLFDLPWRSYVLNLLFLSNYVVEGLGGGPVGHLWSICVEVHFYLAIALAVWLGGRRAVWLVVPTALAVTAMRIEAGVVSNINTHLRVDEILAGGWLALGAMLWGPRLRLWLAGPARMAGATGLLAALFAVSAHDAGAPLTYLRPYLAMGLVGCLMHGRIAGLHAILQGRAAAYVARISYALYIWHPLAIHGIMNTGSRAERYLLKRPLSLGMAWAAAHLSTFVWESYWQRRARIWLNRKSLR